MNSNLDEGYTVLHWNSVNARENVLQNTYTEGSAIFDIHVKKNVPVEVTGKRTFYVLGPFKSIEN